MKKCPFCAEQIQEEAIKCRYCGEMLNASVEGRSPAPAVGQAPAQSGGGGMVGGLAFLAGLALVVFSLCMDTSVAVPGGASMFAPTGRVNNIGLMHDQQTYLILGIALAVLGGAAALFAGGKGGQSPGPVAPASVRPARTAPVPGFQDRKSTAKEQAEACKIAGMGFMVLGGLAFCGFVNGVGGPPVGMFSVVMALLGVLLVMMENQLLKKAKSGEPTD